MCFQNIVYHPFQFTHKENINSNHRKVGYTLKKESLSVLTQKTLSLENTITAKNFRDFLKYKSGLEFL